MALYNCDWLSFTADFENYQGVFQDSKSNTINPEYNKHLARLFARLDEQREKQDDSGYIDLGLWKFQVLNHGSRSYYYLLHNEDMEIRLARFRSKKEDVFPVFVHFKSQFLWSSIYNLTALIDKYRLVIEWLEDVLNGKYITSKINRIDLACHTDDVPADLNAEQFVGYHTLDTTRRTHRVVSGVDIGSRRSEKLFLRIYNKYLEARATKKQWFFTIWEHAGLNIRKVWNVEFQINREFFSDFKLGKKKLDTAEEVIERMAALWYYLMNDWVSYRIPDNGRRSRWSLHPWWVGLSTHHECKELISRERQRELPAADMLIPAIRGYLSSYAARKGGVLDDGTLFADLYKEILDYEDKSGKSFDEVTYVKQQLLDPEQVVDQERIAKLAAFWERLENDPYKHHKKVSIFQTLESQGLDPEYNAAEVVPEPVRPVTEKVEQVTTDEIYRQRAEEHEKRDAGTSPSSEL